MLCEYVVYGHLPNSNLHAVSVRERIAIFRFFKNLKRRTKTIKNFREGNF